MAHVKIGKKTFNVATTGSKDISEKYSVVYLRVSFVRKLCRVILS